MDRQLSELERAFQQRLSRLETEMRLIRQRAMWHGAVRSTPITPTVGVTGPNAVTLAQVDVSAGAWLITAWATCQIDDAGAGAGADVVSVSVYTRLAEEPSTTPKLLRDTAAGGAHAVARNAAGAAFFTVPCIVPLSSERGMTVFMEGSQGDYSGSTHNVLWRNGWLIAQPL